MGMAMIFIALAAAHTASSLNLHKIIVVSLAKYQRVSFSPGYESYRSVT